MKASSSASGSVRPCCALLLAHTTAPTESSTARVHLERQRALQLLHPPIHWRNVHSTTLPARPPACPAAALKTCDDSEPAIGSDMEAIAANGCDGTLAGYNCVHKCKAGYNWGHITCNADGKYAVQACSGETLLCAF